MSEEDIPKKLLWMDLEMTGLDPIKQKIIEVAVVVTDFELNELDRYEAVIHQPEEVLEAAEAWPKEHMQKQFDETRASELTEPEVVAYVRRVIKKNFGQEPAILAGNSIHQDRRFIRQWWQPVEELLHYRMFDVSTLKLWVQGTRGKQFEKNKDHRAMGDILESIEEWKWSLEQLRDK